MLQKEISRCFEPSLTLFTVKPQVFLWYGCCYSKRATKENKTQEVSGERFKSGGMRTKINTKGKNKDICACLAF